MGILPLFSFYSPQTSLLKTLFFFCNRGAFIYNYTCYLFLCQMIFPGINLSAFVLAEWKGNLSSVNVVYKAQNALVSWRCHLPSLMLLNCFLSNSVFFDAGVAPDRKLPIKNDGNLIFQRPFTVHCLAEEKKKHNCFSDNKSYVISLNERMELPPSSKLITWLFFSQGGKASSMETFICLILNICFRRWSSGWSTCFFPQTIK